MKFLRQGRAYQLKIENGNDLNDALKLDIALWVAISAPKTAFRCDAKFLTLLNTNKDGNITSEEVKRAISWLLEQLPNHEEIVDEFNGIIPLSAINSKTDTGKALLASADYILKEMEAVDKGGIDLDTIRKFQDVVKTRPLNGDGVISIHSAPVCKEPSKADLLKTFIETAVKATGGTLDADGTQGVTEDQFMTFWKAIPDYLAWLKKAEIPAGSQKTDLMMFGAETPAIYALFNKCDADVRNFFHLCELLAFDNRLADKGLSTEGKAGAFDPADPANMDGYLKALPICQANSEGILTTELSKINPIFQAWWSEVIEKIVKPVLGNDKTGISLKDWNALAATLAPYGNYLASQAGGICAGVATDLLGQFMAETTFPELVHDLAVRDAAVAVTLNDAQEVERLLLYRRWIIRFANNFISFADLYDLKRHALFERGAAVIDGRWFNVSFPVDNVAAHSAVAKNGNIFVLYLDVEHPDGTKEQVTCPVTVGTKGNLQAGKRGVFFNYDGKQFPAKITQIIENPICVAEALAAPFSKAGKMVEGKIENWSNSTEKEFETKFNTAITPSAAAAAAPAPAAESAPAAGKGKDKSGMLLGASVAFAALGSAVAFISKTLSGMSVTAIWVSVLCVLLALMFPISILAILKLRRQDLSLLLEGNGWAINSRLRLTNSMRRHFSRTGIFPKEADGTPVKRCKKIVSILILSAIIIAAVVLGCCKYFGCMSKEAVCEPAATECVASEAETQDL